MTSKIKAIIYALICVLLWALIPVVAKLGQTNLDNHQFLFWSSVTSFITLIIFSSLNRKLKSFKTFKAKDWSNAVILGLLGTYLYYILLYFGYAKAQGIEVLVLQYCWPIFVVILSVVILKERLTINRTLSVLIGFAGVLLVITKGDIANIHLSNLNVDILVIVAAITFALFSVLSKRVKLESFTLITIYFLTASIVSFISMLAFSDFELPTAETLIPILINGIFVNGLSYVFWIEEVKKTEASFIAPFIFLTPILSAIYLIVFFNEKFLPIYGLGLVTVILGGLINSFQRN